MTPKRQTSPTLVLVTTVSCFVVFAFFLLSFDANVSNAQGPIQVAAADPASAAQGTLNLNVRVNGKGFKNGAKAKWLVTGTTDPGGVTVNSTTFVSSTELTANITVADTAVIANFDIAVENSDGRGGKGTELFAVLAKGGNAGGVSNCPAPIPAPTSDTKCYAAMPGCLDVTFGTNGIVITDPSVNQVGYNRPTGLLVQPDGEIIATGLTSAGINTNLDFVALRYNSDGSLDKTFGDPDPLNPPLRLGYVRTPFSTDYDPSQTSLLQPDGKIVLAGSAKSSGVDVWAVVRYKTDGTLDPSFGIGGKKTLSVSNSLVQDIAIQSDGKLVLVGKPDFTIMRLNQDGSPDASFGTGGKVTASPSSKKGGSGMAYAVAIQRIPAVSGEERIVVGGWAANSPTVFALMRFGPDGTVDSTFGSGGRAYASFFGLGDQIRAIELDQSNRIVAAGLTSIGNSNCGPYVVDAAVARFTQNGALDNSFSGDGKVSTDGYGGYNSADGLLLQADGKIVITGQDSSSDGIVDDFMLMRYNENGTPDSSFGILGTGIVTTDTSHDDWSYAIAQQPWDGKIVLVGMSSTSHKNMALARYWP
jgi:uncharacterized delta-60 repeat protein